MTLRSLDTPATLTGGSIIIDDPFDLVMGSLLIPAEMVDGHFPGNPTIFGPVLSTFKKRK